MSVWGGTEINGRFSEAASKKTYSVKQIIDFFPFSLKSLYSSSTICTFAFSENVK